MKKYFITGVVLIIILAGCTKGTTEPTEPVIKEIQVISMPYFPPDFYSTGNFEMALIALSEKGDAINFGKDAISILIDSTTSSSQHTIKVVDIGFISPQKSKISVGLLLDSSGSMGSNDPDGKRKSAAKAFIKKLLKDSPSHLAMVADFSDWYFRLLQEYTSVSDTAKLFAAIDSVTEAGYTALYSGIRRTLEHTDSVVSASDYSRNALVFTDGEDNASASGDTLGAIINLSKVKGIPIYVIGLGSGVSINDLQRLAKETGGIYAHADSADALDRIFTGMGLGLTKGYSNITANISPVPSPYTYFTIKVKISSGGKTASVTLSFTTP